MLCDQLWEPIGSYKKFQKHMKRYEKLQTVTNKLWTYTKVITIYVT